MAASGWLRGKVKAVPSGDTLVIMSIPKADTIPLEKSITLSSIIAPRLARRYGTDEPFAWDSREFLRKLCIGQDVNFKLDNEVAGSGREFGTVYLGGDKNIAGLVVAHGFAKVKEQGRKGDMSPYVTYLLRLEETAKDQGLGCWSKEHGAAEAAVRILPSLTMGEDNLSEVKGFVSNNKGKALEAIVEQVRDGSTIRVCLIPSFHIFQVYVAGVQAPSMGIRTFVTSAQTKVIKNVDVNGKASGEDEASPMGTLQKPVASAVTHSEIPPDRYGKEAKHFTETKVLNREVQITLEGTDSFDNMIASVYYSDKNTTKDLALELVENGLAKYVEWSANMLGAEAKRKLKNAELQAKREQLRIWTGFKPPATNTTPIHNQKFTGKVIEVVNGYCIIVADDTVPDGSPIAERRVNFSSIRPPKLVDSSGESKTIEHFARASKEFLRTRLIGKQVHVSMEYSRRINVSSGHGADKTNTVDTRVLDYGSVFLPSQVGSSGNLLGGANVAELLLSRGFVDITRHRDYEERSHHYDALLAAYSRAEKAKKGYHAKKDDYPVCHMNDLTMVPAKKARDFLHLLQRNKRHSAIVEYVFSGHRFKLTIPNETSTIAFSFSCVRCPGKNEPYSDDAITLMRRMILQRDVEIEIEAVDRTGTFLGSLWESKNNMACILLEAGLAKLSSFGLDRISNAQTLIRAEKSAQQKKLKVWENYNEVEAIPYGSLTGQNKKETFKVVVSEVIGGGKFYAHIVSDRRLENIQQQFASMKFNDKSKTLADEDFPYIQQKHTRSEVVQPKNNHVDPLPSRWSSLFKDKVETLKGEVPEAKDLSTNDPSLFDPTKGDVVLAQFTPDNSWKRAMIVSEHEGLMEREFLVFYIDYGNQEIVTYSHLRSLPANQSTSLVPPLAKLFRLAFITVPNITDNLGEQAARYLSMVLLDNEKEFKARVEDRDTIESKQEGQGNGEVLLVTLFDDDTESSINAAMLENGLAEIERNRLVSWGSRAAVKSLEEFQEHAKKEHRGIWRLRDVGVADKSAEDGNARDTNDDEDLLAPARAQPPSRSFDLSDLIASKSTKTPKPTRDHVVGG
ncbi:unnamed protein product [Urochloa humidicola]